MISTSSLLDEAAALLGEIKQKTDVLRQGEIPGVYDLLALEGACTDLYFRLGQDLTNAFTQKELATLARKVAAAEHHLAGRMELDLKVGDATEHAIRRTKKEKEEEIGHISRYESNKVYRESLHNAFMYLQQLVSTIKTVENRAQ